MIELHGEEAMQYLRDAIRKQQDEVITIYRAKSAVTDSLVYKALDELHRKEYDRLLRLEEQFAAESAGLRNGI